MNYGVLQSLGVSDTTLRDYREYKQLLFRLHSSEHAVVNTERL